MVNEVEKITKDINGETSIEITEKTKTVKTKSAELFFKLFCDTIGEFQGLKGEASYNLLFALMDYTSKQNFRDNAFFLGYGTPKHIQRQYNIIRSNYYKGFKELLNARILLKHKECDDSNSKFANCYCWNPYLIGKGNPVDIQYLRQTFHIDFDFNNLTVKTSNKAEKITKDGVNMLKNPQNYEVKQIKQDDNNFEVVVEEKDSLKLHD